MRALLFAALFTSGTALAADDLTVLKPGPNDTPLRKLLHSPLLGERQTRSDARRGEVERLKPPADVAARQADLRTKFIAALGGFPQKTPLSATVVGQLKRDGYRVEK